MRIGGGRGEQGRAGQGRGEGASGVLYEKTPTVIVGRKYLKRNEKISRN